MRGVADTGPSEEVADSYEGLPVAGARSVGEVRSGSVAKRSWRTLPRAQGYSQSPSKWPELHEVTFERPPITVGVVQEQWLAAFRARSSSYHAARRAPHP